MLTTRLNPKTAFRYLVAQILGAALAGAALRALFPAALRSIHLGLPTLAPGLTFGQAITGEALVAFAWVVTIGATSWRGTRSGIAPLAVGFVYATCVLVVGPLTGAAGNPARAFGPAFASGTFTEQAIYWAGPALGAFAAAAVHLALFWRRIWAARTIRPENPADALSHYQQGLALYRDGRLEDAAQQFSLATESRPEWPEPYYYIGIVYREFGDEANANAFFDAALHFRGEHKSRQEAIWR